MVDWGIRKGKRERTKNDKSFFIGYEKDDNRQEKKRKGKNEIISFI